MTDKDQRITEIVNRLDSLTLEANALTRELRELTRHEDDNRAYARSSTKDERDTTRTRKQSKNINDHDFEEGDKVIIKNGYKGGRGTKGTVTHTTKTQVTLKDKTGKLYVRKYTNVDKTN
jgi:hypothetical protein